MNLESIVSTVWICTAMLEVGLAVESSTKSVAIVNGLLSTYDHQVRPSADLGTPTTVSLDFFINSISEINEVSMDYSLNLFFRQRWNDPRLRYTSANHSILVHPDNLPRVWIPDIFFKNEKSGKFNNIMTPNTLLRITPNGDVLLSQRVTLNLACPMHLNKFPLDNQTCFMELESYSYTTTDIILKWKDKQPVQWDHDKSFILPDFTFSGAEVSDCTTDYITGNFACLRVTFSIKRQLGYYMTQLYVPSILIVILSWFSFWIDVNATPARVSLGLLTVLTMTTQSARFPTPRVSYIKALDIWTAACLFFVFGGLLEFAIVNVMSRKDDVKPKMKTKQTRAFTNIPELQVKKTDNHHQGALPHESELSNSTPDSGQGANHEHKTKSKRKRIRSKAEEVDYVARFLFPSLFIAFNIIYWVVFTAI